MSHDPCCMSHDPTICHMSPCCMSHDPTICHVIPGCMSHDLGHIDASTMMSHLINATEQHSICCEYDHREEV